MHEQPNKWFNKWFDTFLIIKNPANIRTIEGKERLDAVEKDVSFSHQTNLLQNEIFDTGLNVVVLDKEVDNAVGSGGPMDLAQKSLTPKMLDLKELDKAMNFVNMSNMYNPSRRICCTNVTCYEPGVVPVSRSWNHNFTQLFLHLSFPMGSHDECVAFMAAAKYGAKTALEQKMEDTARKVQVEGGFVDGFNHSGSIWVTCLWVVIAILLTMLIILGIIHYRTMKKLQKWEKQGIESFICLNKTESDKSDKKVAKENDSIV